MKKKDTKVNYEEQETSLFSEIIDFIKVFAITAAVILIFVNFIAHPVTVVGHSMDPNLQDGEYGFTSLISAALSKPSRGDVVVVTMEEGGNKSEWVKRVIGLPGETIQAIDDVVYINGEPLDESAYISEEFTSNVSGNFTEDFGPVTLGEDEYFVMGDNRPVSKDSRSYDVGPVSSSQFYGRGILILYPFKNIGFH